MSTGLSQEAEVLAPSQKPAPISGSKQLGTPANDAVDVTSAQLPTRRIPFRVAGLRVALRWFDMAIASLITVYVLLQSGIGLLSATLYQILPFLLIPVSASWALRAVAAYRLRLNQQILDHLIAVAYGLGFALIGLTLIAHWLYPIELSHRVTQATYATWVAVTCLHIIFNVLGRQMSRAGWISENVVIVGATPNAHRMIARNAKTRELNIVGVFDDRLSRAPRSIGDAPLLGRLDDLLAWERLPEIDRIVVTVTSDARDRVKVLIDRLRVLPQRVVLLLDLEGFDPETESLAKIAHSPAAYVSGSPHDARRAISKRLFDFGFASLMLLAFSPLFLILSIAIKLESRGPVLFRQKRHGFNNQIIKVWKFRSMRDDPDAAERISQQTLADDPRITRIGRFIRQTSIDELPQLVNVLKGEMSIVGPRPHAVGMTTEEQAVQGIVGDYAHRHRAKPGITGWAQINGSRGPVHTKELVRERVRLDMEYVNRSSLWLDLYIMLMTVPRLLGDAKKLR
ncbi:MAG: exopolysaccharide biosynthesis polyprenyl glycosylphosphotransferase [Henriciella sp.]